MPWVKLDDSMPHHPKVIGLSDKTFRAYIVALCYAGRYETDGLLAANLIPTKARAELLSAGLLEQLLDGSVLIHDFLVYNPPRSSREQKREQARERMANARRNTPRGSPNPGPARPEPVPDGTDLGTSASPPTAVGKTASDAAPSVQPTHDQIWLSDEINDAWSPKSGSLTPAAIVKLNKLHGVGTVTSALRSLKGFPPGEAVRSPYAYVDEICSQAVSA